MATQAQPTTEGPPTNMDRKTRGGRLLQYRLTVLQQPERARACGSGSKSAADRRPVDPPPVVELRIFEKHGPDPKDLKDITFNYNANFFLFATLEQARPMAHGRVQTPAATSPPVLTGMPVSGMAYLDRPMEAGYFLFPDLSVRHEGRYKLAFNLYEETKEAPDMDVEKAAGDAKENPPVLAGGSPSFDWRMTVKSQSFNVYSAKKFPGLTESTVLSRTVAEQGCRVRIRRDVRMRRRDGKSGRDYEGGEGDYTRRQGTQTPERQTHEQYRARSQSAASEHGYTPDHQRRSSGNEPYPPGYHPPGSHLDFGGGKPIAPAAYPRNYQHGTPLAPHPPPHPSQAQPPPISPTTAYPPGHSHSSHYRPQLPPPKSRADDHPRPSSQSYRPSTPANGVRDDRRASYETPRYAEHERDKRDSFHSQMSGSLPSPSAILPGPLPSPSTLLPSLPSLGSALSSEGDRMPVKLPPLQLSGMESRATICPPGPIIPDPNPYPPPEKPVMLGKRPAEDTLQHGGRPPLHEKQRPGFPPRPTLERERVEPRSIRFRNAEGVECTQSLIFKTH